MPPVLTQNTILDLIKTARYEIKKGFRYNGYSIWNTHFPPFSNGCLPASVSALNNPVLVSAYPEAKLVVGFIRKPTDSEEDILHKRQGLHDFMALKKFECVSRSKPTYHVWLSLDGRMMLDLTGPIFVDHEDADSDKVFYAEADSPDFRMHEIVFEDSMAEAFVSKLFEAQINSWGGASQIVIKTKPNKNILLKILDKTKLTACKLK